MPGLKSRISIAVAAFRYNVFRKPSILRRVREQDRITVVFFAINVAMWKYDGFFRLLLQDPRFNPVIVSFLYPADTQEGHRRAQEEMKSYFSSKGYPYYDSFDFSSGRWLDIKQLNPDIVFYTQPYDDGFDAYRIRSLWNRCLFAYIPYCYHMEDDAGFYNRLLHNVAWRIFYPTEHHRQIAMRHSLVGGRNIVVSGYPMADRLLEDSPADASMWKVQDEGVKRVIWAPHHSILKDQGLGYSRFLELADGMTSLARKYDGRLQFAFKPHPRLRSMLEKDPSWGVEKTDAFYRLWASMPNTVYVDGDYVELFRSSDAMVHECSSFMGEYLFFGKPVMFAGNYGSAMSHLNDFGKACLECHYKGESIEEIQAFLDDVVLGGKDAMKPRREAFRQSLAGEGGVARRLYEDFKAGL